MKNKRAFVSGGVDFISSHSIENLFDKYLHKNLIIIKRELCSI